MRSEVKSRVISQIIRYVKSKNIRYIRITGHKGAPDLMLIVGSLAKIVVWVEESLSGEQIDWHESLERSGFVPVVVQDLVGFRGLAGL